MNGPYRGLIGIPIQFSSEGTYDPDGRIYSYLWRFGDGFNSTSPNPSHVYTIEGEYIVTLRVFDGKTGTTNYTRCTVRTRNQFPIAKTDGPYESKVGYTIPFNGRDSYDPDGKIVSYLWTFGDGNSSDKKNSYHSYSRTGIYPITLKVIDNDGASEITTTTCTITALILPEPVPTDTITQKGSFKIIVKDESSIRLDYVNVTSIHQPVSQIMLKGFTDNIGEIVFEDITAGFYTLHVSKRGYEDVDFQVKVSKNELNVTIVSMPDVKVEPSQNSELQTYGMGIAAIIIGSFLIYIVTKQQ
jgi:PKD repeat protein